MTALADRLAERIRLAGPISVAEFMAEANALYYATRDPFGAAGDFITAPEVSQVFGELIGAWCADFWQRRAPDPVLLVELGPGRGTLMADALRATRKVSGFAEALRLHLVEQSPVLRAKQAAALGAYAPQWHESIDTLPPGPMLLIANEFLDALPIRQFQQRGLLWYERLIGLDASGEKLAFCPAPQPTLLDGISGARLENEGKIRAICPAAETLGERLGTRLRRQGGAALFIDYGYDWRAGEIALGDTLQALRGHRPVPVLDAPGECDLTAHVDFTAFAEAARFGGAAVYGPITQRVFLLALGLETRQAMLLQHATPSETHAIQSGCRRLIEPAQMGTLFKALVLAGPNDPVPAGFAPGPS